MKTRELARQLLGKPVSGFDMRTVKEHTFPSMLYRTGGMSQRKLEICIFIPFWRQEI